MRYLLMMHAPRGNGDWNVTGWSPDDFKAHIAFMHELNKELIEAGELVGAEGLAPPGQARIVRAGYNQASAATTRAISLTESADVAIIATTIRTIRPGIVRPTSTIPRSTVSIQPP